MSIAIIEKGKTFLLICFFVFITLKLVLLFRKDSFVMALPEQEFTFAKANTEKLQKVIAELKSLRQDVPSPVSNKINEGLSRLESGLHILLDSTYKG
ncbi:hypothetical protein [Leptospira santarosai]|nr:hypothetical protein [Leptospira santarosai]